MKYSLFLFVLLITTGLFSQESGDLRLLISKGDSLVFMNPNEAATIASYVLQNTQDPGNYTEASYILTRAYYLQGRYDDALKVALEWEGKPEYHQGSSSIKLTLLMAEIYLELGLYGLHSDYAKQARKKAANANSALSALLQTEMLHDSATIHSSNGLRLKAISKLQQAKKQAAKEENIRDFKIMNNVNLDMAKWHLHEFALDSARYYLHLAQKESLEHGSGNYLEMLTLLENGHLLFHEQRYEESLENLFKAETLANVFQHPKWLEEIYDLVAANYLALENDAQFQKYSELLNLTARKASLQSDKAINTSYAFFNTKGATALETMQKKENTILWALMGGWLFALTIFGLLVFRYRSQRNQLQLFKQFLEKEEKASEETKEATERLTRSLQIPEETERALIEKLAEFEASQDYTDQGLSLAQLASKFNTNTKYLSEIINTVKGSNFNSYINDLRINYIIDKLRSNPTYRQYKVSYLAEESGFSSHSSFATVFKSVTGISPTAFISILNSSEKRKEELVEK